MAFKDNKIKGIISNNTGNGIHSFGAFQYFQYTDPVLIDPSTNAPLVVDVATAVGLFSSTDSGSNLTEIVLSPTNISISANEATLSNVTVWSANSILTQGRADSRYQNATNNTYANLTGKPTFATVATSGSYTDLANTPNLSLYYLANNPSGYITASCLTYGNIANTPNLSLYYLANNPTGYITASCLTYSNISGTPNLSLYYLANNPTGYITAACLTYANIANTPNLSLYLTTANAATTYLPISNFSYSNLTGKPTTLSGYGITDGLTSATAASTYQTISGMSSYLTISSAAATYLPSANFTYANITGKPTLATVATSGNYSDLSNKPASYTLPAATNSTLGGVIVGANLTISANGTLSANIPAGGGGFANGDTLNGGTW